MTTDPKEILEQKPPSILYHYTNQAGLLGILQKREIWATHTQYLNDDSEFRRALKFVRDTINERTAAGVASEPASDTWREMFDATRGIENINVCVCSFSKVQDSLSQWRAYSGPTSGFAIGFSGDSIRALVTKHTNLYLAPCIYSEADQMELIRKLVDGVFDENMVAKRRIEKEGEKEEDELFHFKHGGDLIPRLHRYAPIVKHSKFEEEQEWRIISRPVMNSGTQFGFREGKSTIIPYYRVKLDLDQVSAKVVEIVIGPTPRRYDAAQAVSKLLVSVGLKDVKTVDSDVPYRNW